MQERKHLLDTSDDVNESQVRVTLSREQRRKSYFIRTKDKPHLYLHPSKTLGEYTFIDDHRGAGVWKKKEAINMMNLIEEQSPYDGLEMVRLTKVVG